MYLSLQLHLVEVCILAALGDVVETLYYVSTYELIYCHCHSISLQVFRNELLKPLLRFLAMPGTTWQCPQTYNHSAVAQTVHALSRHESQHWNTPGDIAVAKSTMFSTLCWVVVDLLILFETPTRFGCRLVVSISSLVQAHVCLFCFVLLLNFVLGPCKWATAAALLPRMHSGRWTSFSDSIRCVFETDYVTTLRAKQLYLGLLGNTHAWVIWMAIRDLSSKRMEASQCSG